MSLGNAAHQQPSALLSSQSMLDGPGSLGGSVSGGGLLMGQTLHLTARQIKMDLEAARRELLRTGPLA